MSKKTEALEEEREKRLAERAEVADAQYEIDLEARLELEEQYGVTTSVKATRHVTGQPTMALIRMPTAKEYKRFRDQVGRAVQTKSVKAQADAGELLARSCWVYPAGDEPQKAMLEAYPGLLSSLTVAAAAMAEGKQEDEGKG